jgi:hypothetical protein
MLEGIVRRMLSQVAKRQQARGVGGANWPRLSTLASA